MNINELINQIKTELKNEVKAELKAELRQNPIKHMNTRKYRKWSPAEKAGILREAQAARETNAWGAINLVCKRRGITTTHLHNWAKQAHRQSDQNE